MTVTVVPANLPGGGNLAGTFNGEIVFTAGTDVATIPVSVMVGPNVFNQLNAISFTMPEGGANPLPQVLPVVGTGTNFLFSSASYNGNGGAWLSISNKGSGCCSTPEAITVSVVNGSTLPAGTYTGEIIFTEYSQQTIWMTVPVTLP